MTDGFLNIDSTGISGHANILGGNHSDRTDGMSADRLRTAVGWLPIAVIVAAAGWFLSTHAWETATEVPIHLAAASPGKVGAGTPATGIGMANGAFFDPLTSEALVPAQPAPVDRLTVSSQSWRKGGLGSNALVTLTLRNENGYAVKDVELACAFLRPDGSHLTDRSRVIPDVINMKSRKTFVHVHVGFVNVNAAKAKCSPVSASHI
jgi:hypothetical protein